MWLAKEFSGTQPYFSQLTSRSRFQTMILLLYLKQFYKTELGDGSSPNRNSCFIVSSRLSILLLCSHRNNRTCLRDELYANGKLKEGIPGEPCEDDLTLSTRVESISSIKFFNYSVLFPNL